jgi:hypothetical protein
MNRDKQIEEMQNDLIAISKSPIMIDGLEHWSDAIAEELYNAGYRKASDVVREIIDLINDFFPKVREITKGGVVVNLLPAMQEALVKKLKKKYEILNSWEELTHTCQVEIPHTIESIADLAFTESEGEG